jgi:hypothetical protein
MASSHEVVAHTGVRVYPVRPDLVTLSGYAILGLLTVAVPGFFLWGLLHPDSRQQVPPFLVIPWLLIVGWNWVVLLRRPHRIELHEGGTVVFVPKLGEATSIHARDITAIRVAFWGNGEPIVRHTMGRIRLLHAYRDFDDLLRQLTAINPNIKTTGKEFAPVP